MEFGKYINEIYEFEICYPSQWYIKENCANSIVTFISNEPFKAQNGDVFSSVNIMRYNNSYNFTILELLENTKTDLNEYLRDLRVQKTNTYNQNEGVLVYSGIYEEKKLAFIQFIILVKKEIYSITACCEYAECNLLYDIISKMKDSLILNREIVNF
jgi:hypothetical protein